ncbi:MAG TPA: HDOD domain-containing protein [Candidatus Baltobacteraceae bacterium]|jgi:HD-like signal output (HDOD) protein|nr:HDOD domain-containing protein [Candidatus Baltobacteraceae bacterium]
MNVSHPTTKDDQVRPAESARATSWRVLFVGADPLWLGQIKGDIGFLHPDWLCLEVPEISAMEYMDWRLASAVVIDGRSAGAREWLEQARKERPSLNCLIRCDVSEKPVAEVWKGLGYPMLASHSDASTLVSSLRRNLRLMEWRADPAIQRLLPSLRKLPATPRLFLQVTEELRSSNGSLEVVAQLIRQDPVMSAKMLQLVNSVFFALHREVSDTLDAATILGTERLKSLILLAGIFTQYHEAEGVCPSVEALLAHSIQVGVYARAIAFTQTRDAATAEAAFTAGVLHDMGKVILAGNLPGSYMEVRKLRVAKSLSDDAAELEIFGATHANVAACLLASWGLPLAILEAVAWHHEPERSSEKAFCLLAAVHAANAFAHEGEGAPAQLHQEFFERIGLAESCGRWRRRFGVDEALPSRISGP